MSERVPGELRPGELTCRQLAELVSDYIEGALPRALHAQIVGHLAACQDCTTYVEQVRTTIAVTRELAGGVVDPPMRDALLALFRGWAGRTGPGWY